MKSKGMIRNTVILLVITLVAGLLLSLVYEITKDPIAQAEENAKKAAYAKVLSAKEYVEIDNAELLLEKVNDGLASGTYNQDKIDYTRTVVDEVLCAKNEDGKSLGYVITTTSKNGYGGNIQVTFGLNLEKAITGFTVLSQSETAGFGAKCAETAFQEQYKEKTVDNFDDVIISGATYTSTALKEAVGAGFVVFDLVKEGK